jgi:hypothetical protein
MRIVLVALVLVACGDGRTTLADLADRACACTQGAPDGACGVRTLAEMTEWVRDPERRTRDDDAASSERLITCVAATGVRPTEMMERLRELR